MALFYGVPVTSMGGRLPPHRPLRNDQREEFIMIAIFDTPEPTGRGNDPTERQVGSSPQVIDFFEARNRMLSETNDRIGSFGYGHRDDGQRISLRRELSPPINDPMEDWANSLISAAALVSLLIGILCLPNVTATKTERSQTRPISHAETCYVTPKQR